MRFDACLDSCVESSMDVRRSPVRTGSSFVSGHALGTPAVRQDFVLRASRGVGLAAIFSALVQGNDLASRDGMYSDSV